MREPRELIISIHALLAESDNLRVVDGSQSSIISIHALLAESDTIAFYPPIKPIISIHALLAESDRYHRDDVPDFRCHFYPRSPCGERLSAYVRVTQRQRISIHALLAESDS